jgi:hypothetical protein
MLTGFFALADIIQWIVSFPDSLTYWGFNNRFLLVGVSGISMLIAFILNFKGRWIAQRIMVPIAVLHFGLFIAGFIAPSYIMFRSEHKSADFLNHAEVTEDYLVGSDEVMVLVKDGDARAFPNKWIVHTHIAGDNVGGEDLVMTYCGLSHLGLAYRSKVDGEELNLKVMTQLQNNLVMFDANSQEPIPQIYGSMCNSGKNLDPYPSTVMSYSSYKKLYPEGLVYYFQPQGPVDEAVYSMLQSALYAEGAQYDKVNTELSFNTIAHDDNRLHPKEQVYGVTVNGESMAFTLDFLKANDYAIEEIGGQVVTVKYFQEYDFVNIFYGEVAEVDPHGYLNGEEIEAVPHSNKVLWKVWTNFFRNTTLRS